MAVIETRQRFEQYFEENYARIYNYICFRVGNPAVAEDLTAEVFARAYRYLESFDDRKGALYTWLCAIARTRVTEYHRETVRNRALQHQMGWLETLRCDEGPEACYIHKETLRHLGVILRELPEDHRELLAMKYMLKMTNRDIAVVTGKSESAVGSALHRILGALRKKMEASP